MPDYCCYIYPDGSECQLEPRWVVDCSVAEEDPYAQSHSCPFHVGDLKSDQPELDVVYLLVEAL